MRVSATCLGLAALLFVLPSCNGNGNGNGPTPPPPTPTPSPTPTPDPYSACPKTPDPFARIVMRNKPYGAHGVDSTVRILGDPEFCELIHGTLLRRLEEEDLSLEEVGLIENAISAIQSDPNNCNLEGWPTRTMCEMQLLGAYSETQDLACPHWQFKNPAGDWVTCHDDRAAYASCDHFGSTERRDDPQTPTTGDTLDTLVGFEGEPKQCGLDRGPFGPWAGFFMIAHTPSGVEVLFRACRPDGDGCGWGTPMVRD